VRVTVREGVAEALPVGDESFDAAIASRVLCTVRDQERALAELRRVVRPGAELRFLEHVRSPHARTAWLQERLDGSGIWPWLGGGCHCARDTLGAVTAAGFGVQRVRAFALGPTWMFVNPHVVGVARATPTLQEGTWPSARIVRDVSEVAALKQQPGDAIYAVGGPGLVGSLINAALVDELRLILHPVSAGAGEGEATVGKLPHCEGLELVAVEPLAAGRVHLTYRLGASTPQSAE
jgi:dihydrofolate reductase